MTRRVTGSVILAAAATLAVSLSACSSTQTSSAPPAQQSDPAASATPQGVGTFKQWPAQVYSPYFETWTNGSLSSLASQSGANYFNLG